MAFYSYMMEKYSNVPNPQNLTKEQRMDNAKAVIERQYIESINNYLEISRSLNSSSGYEEVSTVSKIICDQQAELSLIQQISAQEYFTQLARNEQYEIGAYIKDCHEQMGNAIIKADKIQNNEGLSSKFYNFTGLGTAKTAEYNEQIENSKIQIETAKESFVEWANMPEQQVDYVLARYEQEGITYLDVKNLNDYALNQQNEQAPVVDDACQQ